MFLTIVATIEKINVPYPPRNRRQGALIICQKKLQETALKEQTRLYIMETQNCQRP